MDEPEEHWLFVLGDFEAEFLLLGMPFEKALDEEEERDAAPGDADNLQGEQMIEREDAVGAEQNAQRNQAEVEQQKDEQSDEQQVLPRLVRGREVREVVGDVR